MTAVRQGQKPMFLHWQSYTLHRRAPLVRKGATPMLTSQEKRWSCEDVVKEALRVKGWCSHVRKPMQPLVTHHDSPDVETIALPEWIARTMKSCREESGAQLRKNTVALQTFIASVPQDGPRIEDLRDKTVEFLDRQFRGKARVSHSIIHLDESQPHAHIWMLPSEENIARQKWELGGLMRMPRQAMTGFLDIYWEDVAKPLGLSRISDTPQWMRVTRKELVLIQRNRKTTKGLMRQSKIYQAGFLDALGLIAKSMGTPMDDLCDLAELRFDDIGSVTQHLRDRHDESGEVGVWEDGKLLDLLLQDKPLDVPEPLLEPGK